MTRYAAVGNDGMRPVVWGLGATEEEAEADARRWLAEVGASGSSRRSRRRASESTSMIRMRDKAEVQS